MCSRSNWPHSLMDLFARNGRQKAFWEQKNSGKMSDNCLGSNRGVMRASMETQSGAKAPLVSPLSQSLCLFSPPLLLPTELDGPALFTFSKKKQTHKWKSRSQKGLFFPVCLSADRFGLLRSCRSSLGSALPFHFQAAYYPLYRDITSTQTSSLCLSWNRRVLY